MESPNVFLWIMVFLVLGMALGLFINWPQLTIAVFLMLTIIFIFKKEKIIFIFLIFLALGAIRANQAIYSLKQSELLFFNDKNIEITFLGRISEEPQERTLNQRVVVKIEKIFEPVSEKLLNRENQKQTGKVLVWTDKKEKYIIGEKIIFKGTLESPKDLGEFDYKDYLRKRGILSIMRNPVKIERVADAPFYYRGAFKIKEKLREIINEGLVYPQNALLGAIVLGDQRDLPDDLKESFNKSGIRHITAISGMNITILINILMAIFMAVGIKRKNAGLAIMIFILFHLFIIGFQPSVLRASIMGFGLILAQVFSRMSDSIRFLLFSATIMLLLNPFIFFDIGFQLSFLAVAGINYLLPFFNYKLKKIPEILGAKSAFLMTIAAQIFTLPILLYNFGHFSLLSPLANILVLPLMPFILGAGILGLVLGLIFLPLGFLAFAPLSMLFGYIIFVSDSISGITLFSINLKFSLILLFFYYLALVCWVYHLKQKEKLWFLER